MFACRRLRLENAFTSRLSTLPQERSSITISKHLNRSFSLHSNNTTVSNKATLFKISSPPLMDVHCNIVNNITTSSYNGPLSLSHNNKNSNNKSTRNHSTSNDTTTTTKGNNMNSSESSKEEPEDPYPNVDISLNKDYEAEARMTGEQTNNKASGVTDLDLKEYTKEVMIKMPDMDGAPGRIVKWYKEEGDVILRGDLLCDIQIKSLSFTFGITSDDEGMTIMGDIVTPIDHEKPLSTDDPMCVTWHKPMIPNNTKE